MAADYPYINVILHALLSCHVYAVICPAAINFRAVLIEERSFFAVPNCNYFIGFVNIILSRRIERIVNIVKHLAYRCFRQKSA